MKSYIVHTNLCGANMSWHLGVPVPDLCAPRDIPAQPRVDTMVLREAGPPPDDLMHLLT